MKTMLEVVVNAKNSRGQLISRAMDARLKPMYADDGRLIRGIVIVNDGVLVADDLPNADEEYDNGKYRVCVYYEDGVSVFVESGYHESIVLMPEKTSIYGYFDRWDFGDVGREASLVLFGLDPLSA